MNDHHRSPRLRRRAGGVLVVLVAAGAVTAGADGLASKPSRQVTGPAQSVPQALQIAVQGLVATGAIDAAQAATVDSDIEAGTVHPDQLSAQGFSSAQTDAIQRAVRTAKIQEAQAAQAQAAQASAATPPAGRTHRKMLRLARCLRRHGYPTIPDPQPDPAPSHSERYDTLYGEGSYWIGIPKSIDAHSARFIRTARACGATGIS